MWADNVVHGWLRSSVSGIWMALHYDDPDVAGAYASEVFGGSYIRIQGIFDTPNARATWNSIDLTWRGLPAVVVTHVAGWDAQYNGNYIFSEKLPGSGVRVMQGKSLTINAQTIALSIA